MRNDGRSFMFHRSAAREFRRKTQKPEQLPLLFLFFVGRLDFGHQKVKGHH